MIGSVKTLTRANSCLQFVKWLVLSLLIFSTSVLAHHYKPDGFRYLIGNENSLPSWVNVNMSVPSTHRIGDPVPLPSVTISGRPSNVSMRGGTPIVTVNGSSTFTSAGTTSRTYKIKVFYHTSNGSEREDHVRTEHHVVTTSRSFTVLPDAGLIHNGSKGSMTFSPNSVTDNCTGENFPITVSGTPGSGKEVDYNGITQTRSYYKSGPPILSPNPAGLPPGVHTINVSQHIVPTSSAIFCQAQTIPLGSVSYTITGPDYALDYNGSIGSLAISGTTSFTVLQGSNSVPLSVSGSASPGREYDTNFCAADRVISYSRGTITYSPSISSLGGGTHNVAVRMRINPVGSTLCQAQTVNLGNISVSIVGLSVNNPADVVVGQNRQIVANPSPANRPLSYSIVQGSGTGATINSSGLVTGIHSPGQIRVRVTDVQFPSSYREVSFKAYELRISGATLIRSNNSVNLTVSAYPSGSLNTSGLSWTSNQGGSFSNQSGSSITWRPSNNWTSSSINDVSIRVGSSSSSILSDPHRLTVASISVSAQDCGVNGSSIVTTDIRPSSLGVVLSIVGGAGTGAQVTSQGSNGRVSNFNSGGVVTVRSAISGHTSIYAQDSFDAVQISNFSINNVAIGENATASVTVVPSHRSASIQILSDSSNQATLSNFTIQSLTQPTFIQMRARVNGVSNYYRDTSFYAVGIQITAVGQVSTNFQHTFVANPLPAAAGQFPHNLTWTREWSGATNVTNGPNLNLSFAPEDRGIDRVLSVRCGSSSLCTDSIEFDILGLELDPIENILVGDTYTDVHAEIYPSDHTIRFSALTGPEITGEISVDPVTGAITGVSAGIVKIRAYDEASPNYSFADRQFTVVGVKEINGNSLITAGDTSNYTVTLDPPGATLPSGALPEWSSSLGTVTTQQSTCTLEATQVSSTLNDVTLSVSLGTSSVTKDVTFVGIEITPVSHVFSNASHTFQANPVPSGVSNFLYNLEWTREWSQTVSVTNGSSLSIPFSPAEIGYDRVLSVQCGPSSLCSDSIEFDVYGVQLDALENVVIGTTFAGIQAQITPSHHEIRYMALTGPEVTGEINVDPISGAITGVSTGVVKVRAYDEQHPNESFADREFMVVGLSEIDGVSFITVGKNSEYTVSIEPEGASLPTGTFPQWSSTSGEITNDEGVCTLEATEASEVTEDITLTVTLGSSSLTKELTFVEFSPVRLKLVSSRTPKRQLSFDIISTVTPSDRQITYSFTSVGPTGLIVGDTGTRVTTNTFGSAGTVRIKTRDSQESYCYDEFDLAINNQMPTTMTIADHQIPNLGGVTGYIIPNANYGDIEWGESMAWRMKIKGDPFTSIANFPAVNALSDGRLEITESLPVEIYRFQGRINGDNRYRPRWSEQKVFVEVEELTNAKVVINGQNVETITEGEEIGLCLNYEIPLEAKVRLNYWLNRDVDDISDDIYWVGAIEGTGFNQSFMADEERLYATSINCGNSSINFSIQGCEFIELTKNRDEVHVGQKTKISAVFSPITPDISDITWTLDAVPIGSTVEAPEDGKHSKNITPDLPGEYSFTATCGGVTHSLSFTVEHPVLTMLKANSIEHNYNNKTVRDGTVLTVCMSLSESTGMITLTPRFSPNVAPDPELVIWSGGSGVEGTGLSKNFSTTVAGTYELSTSFLDVTFYYTIHVVEVNALSIVDQDYLDESIFKTPFSLNDTVEISAVFNPDFTPDYEDYLIWNGPEQINELTGPSVNFTTNEMGVHTVDFAAGTGSSLGIEVYVIGLEDISTAEVSSEDDPPLQKVVHGESVTFSANSNILDENGESIWPDENNLGSDVQWYVNDIEVATGESYQHTFNSASVSESDYYVVKAICGDSEKFIRVLVQAIDSLTGTTDIQTETTEDEETVPHIYLPFNQDEEGEAIESTEITLQAVSAMLDDDNQSIWPEGYPEWEIIYSGAEEAYQPSVPDGTVDNFVFHLEYPGTYTFSATLGQTLSLKVTVFDVDLDIDSDNNNYSLTEPFLDPDQSEDEDELEGNLNQYGKFIVVNDRDHDHDFIPGYADGLTYLQGTGTNEGQQTVHQTPMILEISKLEDLSTSEIKLTFNYSESDPNNISSRASHVSQFDVVHLAAEGSLRIWANKGDDQIKNVLGLLNTGDFINSGVEIPLQTLIDRVVENDPSDYQDLADRYRFRLYVEAVSVPELEVGHLAEVIEVSVQYLSDSAEPGINFTLEDKVGVTPVVIDLDVDSNNDSTDADYPLTTSDRTIDEDLIESYQPAVIGDPRFPQKILKVNSDDIDKNGIPNYADGLDHIEGAGGMSENFAPIYVEIPSYVNPDMAKVRFFYSASDPKSMVVSETEQLDGAESVKAYELPEESYLRLWSKDGNDLRDSDSVSGAQGDYIAGDLEEPEAFILSEIGEEMDLGNSHMRTWKLFIEAVRPSSVLADQSIKIEVDPLGDDFSSLTIEDEVSLTLVDRNVQVVHDSTQGLSPAAVLSHPVLNHDTSAMVYHHNQSLQLTANDFSFPRPNFNPELVRYARDSFLAGGKKGSLGQNWVHQFEERFEIAQSLKDLIPDEVYDGSLSSELSAGDFEELITGSLFIGFIYHDQEGRTSLMRSDEDIEVPEDYYFSFQYDKKVADDHLDDEIILTYENGLVKTFKRKQDSSSFTLVEMKDAFDQTVSIESIPNRRYEQNVDLVSYPGSINMNFNYYAAGLEQDELLQSVSLSGADLAGHTVTFTYTDGDQLKTSSFSDGLDTLASMKYTYQDGLIDNVINDGLAKTLFSFSRSDKKVIDASVGGVLNYEWSGSNPVTYTGPERVQENYSYNYVVKGGNLTLVGALPFLQEVGENDAVKQTSFSYLESKLERQIEYGSSSLHKLGETEYLYELPQLEAEGSLADDRRGLGLVTKIIQKSGDVGEDMGDLSDQVTEYDYYSKEHNFALKSYITPTSYTETYGAESNGFRNSKTYTGPNGNLSESYSKTSLGQRETYSPANGQNEVYRYDDYGFMEERTVTLGGSSGTSVYLYTYNKYGNLEETTSPLLYIENYTSKAFGPIEEVEGSEIKAGHSNSKRKTVYGINGDGVVDAITNYIPIAEGEDVDHVSYTQRIDERTLTIDSIGRNEGGSRTYQDQNLSTVMTYVDNLVTSEKNEDNTYNKYAYDELARVKVKAMNVASNFSFNGEDSVPTSSLPSGAEVYFYEYDVESSLLNQVHRQGHGESSKSLFQSFQYDKFQRQVKVTHHKKGIEEQQIYNLKGREIESKVIHIQSGETISNVKTTTDISGYKTSQVDLLRDSESDYLVSEYDPVTRTSTSTDPLQNQSRIERSGLEQRSIHLDGTIGETIFDKQGNPVSMGAEADVSGKASAVYDSSNGLSEYVEPDLSNQAQKFAQSGYNAPNVLEDFDGITSRNEIDEDGTVEESIEDLEDKRRSTKVINEVENKVNWLTRGEQATKTSLDNLGRPTRKDYFYNYSEHSTGPIDTFQTYSYHSRGMLQSMRLRNGALLTFDYDTYDRLTQIRRGSEVLRKFENFNEFNIPELITEYGVNGVVAVVRDYDHLGRMTHETLNNKTVEFAYDNLDRITSITYSSGKVVSYDYEGSGPLDQIRLGNDVLVDYSYDNNYKNVDFITFQNKTLDYGYYSEKLGLLSSVAFDSTKVVSNQFNTVGLIWKTHEWGDPLLGVDTTDRVYTYDGLRRLEQVQAGGSWDTFGDTNLNLDEFENRSGQNTVDGVVYNYEVKAARNQIEALNGIEFDYDANGTLIADHNNVYQTDIWGRVIRVQSITDQAISKVVSKPISQEGKVLLGEVGALQMIEVQLNTAPVGEVSLYFGDTLIPSISSFSFSSNTLTIQTIAAMVTKGFTLVLPEGNSVSGNVDARFISNLVSDAQTNTFGASYGVSTLTYPLSETGIVSELQLSISASFNGVISVLENNTELEATIENNAGLVEITLNDGFAVNELTVNFSEAVDVYSTDVYFDVIDLGSSYKSIEYVYDAFGRRVQRNINGDAHLASYSGLKMIDDGAGNEYVFGSVLNDVCAVLRNGEVINTITDNRGTVFGLVKDGSVVTRYNYSASGQREAYYVSGEEDIAFGYTGMYLEETDLYHTHFRDYDVVTGRWLAEDPAGYVDGLNLYAAYFGVNYVDPDGLSKGTPRGHVSPYQTLQSYRDAQTANTAARNTLRRELQKVIPKYSTNQQIIEAHGFVTAITPTNPSVGQQARSIAPIQRNTEQIRRVTNQVRRFTQEGVRFETYRRNFERTNPETALRLFASTTNQFGLAKTNQGVTNVGLNGRLESQFFRVSSEQIGTGTATNASSRTLARNMGRPTDDAGHGRGRNLGGKGGARSENIFPQNPHVNRGQYSQIEQSVANSARNGNEVYVMITYQYSNVNSTRPTQVVFSTLTRPQFSHQTTLGGGIFRSTVIQNP